jgi:hypothetical protein
MSALELQQRGLLALIKNRGGVPDDPYLKRVANSRELAMVRGIALWWRSLGLQMQCRFTPRLLKRRVLFDALVADFFDHNATSPFVEELTLSFLAALHGHDDPLIRALSRFEHAFLAVKAGSTESYEILWDRDPDALVLALETGAELPAPEPGALYRMRISRDLPGMIACVYETEDICSAG